MSRIGRQPISVPAGVSVEVREDSVRVKGTQGEMTQGLPPGIRVEQRDGALHVMRPNDEPRSRALHGLGRSLVANAVAGVSNKFQKQLEIVGIGYKAAVENGVVTLNVGYSHPIVYKIPATIDLTVEKQTLITVRGIDRQQVGQVCAEIRDMKRPDVYKGKGIRFVGETLRRKVGKTGA